MRKKALEIIVCPNCKAEYLPSEIFIPNQFFQNPGTIIKNKEGKIEHFTGKSIDSYETFVCDYCKKKFNISSKLTFVETLDTKYNFDEEYETKLNENNFSLDEE